MEELDSRVVDPSFVPVHRRELEKFYLAVWCPESVRRDGSDFVVPTLCPQDIRNPEIWLLRQ